MSRFGSRMLYGSIALIVAYLGATAVFGDRGLISVRKLQKEAQRLQDTVHTIEEENQQLRGEVQQLRKDEVAIERVAREEHGFLRNGEVVYQFRDEVNEQQR